MRRCCRIATVLLVFACPLARLNAQQNANNPSDSDLNRRLEQLETEVKELRAALAKSNSPDASAAVPTASSAVAAVSPSPAAPSISHLLGSTTLSGFVDTYYGYNINQPQTRLSGLRSFDAPANQFALNLVELVVDKTPEATNSRMGYHIALGFGNAMNAVNSTDPAGLGFAQYLKEAYFSYLAPAGKGLTIDVGKFVTPHGAEVIETKDDWNYSRGLLFSYAIPYYHYGVRLKYAFNSKYSLAGYVVNGWNDIVDGNTGKTYGVSFSWNPTKSLGVVQNYMAGPEGIGTNSHWRQLSDTVLTYAATKRLSLMVNYDYGRGDMPAPMTQPVFWTGVGAYARYVFNSRYAVATRYEYYDDHDGFTTATPQHLNEVTTTVERLMAHHLLSRLEFRHDVSTAPVFLKGSTPVPGQSTIAAGMVYMFDTREQ